MGLAHVTVRITNLSQNGQPYDADFLVETGAIDCMVPSDELRKAEVRPEWKKVYELANGQPAEYEIGFARVLFTGEENVAQVIFGPPPGVEPILGAVALENVGIVVDPSNQTLKHLPASPLKTVKQRWGRLVQISLVPEFCLLDQISRFFTSSA